MESINQFNKGLNKDINSLNKPKGSYEDAQNIRLINDADSTSLSINNILGNDYKVTIPDSPVIQRIDITSAVVGSNITINGQIGAGFDTTGKDGEDLYNYILNDGSYTLLGVQYNVYYDGNHITIVQISPFGIPLIGIVGGLSIITNSVGSYYVPAQTNLEVIGSVVIRDDIYLYTTNNTSLNPGGHSNDSSLAADPSSIGQIWKLTYDKITLAVNTPELIYSNYIDFSTYYAIPPSATLGRYENSLTQRIYWTDNFNKLRSLNVTDPNTLAFDPSILNIVPAVDFDIPILQSMQASTGNDLEAGVIQCAYRLKNTGGAVTTFSELSNVVCLVQPNEANNTGGAGFVGYYGNTQSTLVSKVLNWKIDNIDRDFDRIEIAIIFRDSLTGTPTISLLDDAPITGDDYTVIYDGTQNTTTLTLSEFLALSGAFTHCKTIETKDNRLFAGNIRNQFSELDYDARVYRFPTGSNTLNLVENGAAASYNTATWTTTGTYPIVGWDTIIEDSDAINPTNLATTDPNYIAGQLYKKNSAILGGSGPNISYEFYTVAIAADKDVTAGANLFGVADYSPAPWRSTNPRYFGATDINLGVYSPTNQGGTSLQEYPPAYSNINDGFKYPHISGLLRGYQRNEIYRFGIQFYDKSKNPYFVKWIGDIKMPDYNDVNSNPYYEDGSAAPHADFRPSFTANKNGSYTECFVQSLGIEFTVNIPDELIDLIGGYQIVRVDRTESDKTIISEGYVNKVDRTDYGGMVDSYYMTDLAASSGGNTIGGGTDTPSKGFFVTPDINDATLTIPSQNMTMKLKGIMTVANPDITVDFSGGVGDPYYMWKLYNWSTITNASGPFNIDQITRLDYGQQTQDSATGLTVFNYDYDTVGPNETVGHSMGNSCYYYKLDADIDYTDVLGTGNRFLISIERSLSSQYGGDTYASRANNTYMSCSMYKPVRKSQLGVADVFQIFGGDTFVNMYDSCRWAKNWGGSGRGTMANKYSSTIFFPVSSKINTELRYGTYMNKDMNATYDVGTDFIETYTANPVYSAQNDIRQLFPKPDPFIANEEFDNRIHASEIKINGEFVDSWGVFLPNNYWDVEGSYGPINAFAAMGSQFYFWQDRAFGTMSINPRVMVTDTGTDTQIQLGTGNVLQRHDYISIEVGLQHQWGMTRSSNKLYWMDISKKKFYAFSGSLSPESDIKGMLSWFNTYLTDNINITDKPTYFDAVSGINGIRAVYDYKYNQAIFTFSDTIQYRDQRQYTLVYDDFLNAFSSFMSYAPRVYITDYKRIFSTDPSNLNQIYMHDTGNYGDFYGTVYPSTIKLVVNDNFQYTKVFDNIMYDSQSLLYNSTFDNYQNQFDDTWDTIRVYNDHQNTDFQIIAQNAGLRRLERTWQLQIPRNRVLYNAGQSPNIFDPAELSTPNNKTFGERIRDKYIVVDLKYDNTSNRLLTCNNFRTIYRMSPR